MTEENKTNKDAKTEIKPEEKKDVKKDVKTEVKPEIKPEVKQAVVSNGGNSQQKLDNKFGNRKFGGGGMKKRRQSDNRYGKGEKDEFDQKIIDIARVTRVMKGGKRMRFRACVVVGNKKGKIGVGLAKSADVTAAITKAAEQAKKKVINIQIIKGTIAHELNHKFGAAKVMLKPGKQGTGIIAGGAVRIVLELVGVKDVVGKILGTNNPVNNVKCVVEALSNLKHIDIPNNKVRVVDNKKKEDKKLEDDKKV